MPLASLAHLLGGASPMDGVWTVLKWGVLIAVVGVIRAWSKGYKCTEERELAGRTFIVDGGFSGTGLAVFQALAQRGAQVIALHPAQPTPVVVQLLMLLRETTGNERLYADECDLTSVDSVRAFVLRWRKDARAGLVGDVDVRLDGILFLDDSDALPLGAAQLWAPQRAVPSDEVPLSQHRMRRLTGRHALVQLLMPVLLQSASTSTSPLRIISSVSPFYAVAAAQPAKFRPLDLDYTEFAAGPSVNGHGAAEFPRWAPWEAEGQVALASVLLWRELQHRLTGLAGKTNRPSAESTATAAAPAVEAGAAPILALSVCSGLTRASVFALLSPSVRRPGRLLLAMLLTPLVWLFAKSAEEAAEGVLGALMGGVEGWQEAERAARGPDGEDGDGVQSKPGSDGPRKRDEGKRRMRVKGGALYREGKEVRISALAELSPKVGAALWDNESKLVERLLVAAVEAQKMAEQEGETKEPLRDGTGSAANAELKKHV